MVLHPQAESNGSSAQQQFKKQKDEVLGETKGNIKEAEDTLKVAVYLVL